MLPNYFLPEVDELPFSWMNRLALANGFKDTNDMLQSLGFIKGKAVKRQHDYLLKITKLMPKNDWTITLMKMYLAEDLQQERLIPELNEEEHLYLCPCCMQEDIKTHGAVVYHYQHQYPGAFTCWKHGVNLLHVAPDARLKPIPDESDLTPVVGGYDSEREMRQFRRCYSKSSLYYRVTKYQLETLLSDNHLTVDNIAEVFRTTKYNEEMPVVAANIVCNSTMNDAVRIANNTAPSDSKTKNIRKNRKEESITFMESNTIGSRLNTEETPPMIPMNDTEPEVLAEPEPQNNSEIVSFDEALAKIMEKM